MSKLMEVVGTMFFKNGKLLIDKPRSKKTFQMIGGKVENGETIREAAIRECHEELGEKAIFDEKLLEFVMDFEEIATSDPSKKIHMNIFKYNGELEGELDKRVHLKSLYNFRYDSIQGIKKILIPLKVLFNKRKIFKEYVDNDEYKAQIAFLEGAITRIFGVKTKKKTQKIAWVHNDISKVFGKGPKSKIKRIIDRNTYEKYDTLVFVSIDNLDKFNKVYDDMLLPHETVVNNYINSQRILDLAKNEIKEEDKNLFTDKTLKIVQVSRLVEQKAIDRLIKVHTKLIKEGVKHNIYIIGDGPLKEKLEKQIKENNVSDTFKLLGARENPYPYMKKADVVSLFSRFEGYPMVIEEAKVLNKYILATNTATREALINYSKNSQIVENSEEGIEKAIKFAVKNKKKILKSNEEFVYENDKLIEKIIKIINSENKRKDKI